MNGYSLGIVPKESLTLASTPADTLRSVEQVIGRKLVLPSGYNL